MKTLGKVLFWLGFWIMIGIVIAYLVLMLCGAAVFATWVAALSLCGIVLIGGLLMLIGRNYEHAEKEKHRDRG